MAGGELPFPKPQRRQLRWQPRCFGRRCSRRPKDTSTEADASTSQRKGRVPLFRTMGALGTRASRLLHQPFVALPPVRATKVARSASAALCEPEDRRSAALLRMQARQQQREEEARARHAAFVASQQRLMQDEQRDSLAFRNMRLAARLPADAAEIYLTPAANEKKRPIQTTHLSPIARKPAR